MYGLGEWFHFGTCPETGTLLATGAALSRQPLSYNQGMNPQQKSAAAFFRPNDRAPERDAPGAPYPALHFDGRGLGAD